MSCRKGLKRAEPEPGAYPEANAYRLTIEEEGSLNMDEKIITRRIAELREMQRDRGTPERSVLETAMFLEDVFGIRLEDAEMDEAHIGPDTDLEILTSLVVQKLGAAPSGGDVGATGKHRNADGLRSTEESEA